MLGSFSRACHDVLARSLGREPPTGGDAEERVEDDEHERGDEEAAAEAGRGDHHEAPDHGQRGVPGLGERPVGPAPERFDGHVAAAGRELVGEPERGSALGIAAGAPTLEPLEALGCVERLHGASMMPWGPIGYNAGVSGYAEDELVDVAEEAARAAAAELMPRFGERASGVQAKSTPTDLVSDADVAAEEAIRVVLGARRAGDAILGEEGGASGDGDMVWVVDPLDGTINYLFGIPAFAVSVAVEDGDGAVAGVVLDPVRDECFAATRSGDAMLNGAAVAGSSREDLATAMVATGFGYDAAVRERQAAVLARVLPRVRDIRRVGAAALDLAWCACGRFDAYYERGVQRWDVAAGNLICRRAGLEVRELPASGVDAAGVVAGPRRLAEELVRLVA